MLLYRNIRGLGAGILQASTVELETDRTCSSKSGRP